MIEADPGYVIVNAHLTEPHKFNVALMKHTGDDEYVAIRVSSPLPRAAADSLAKSWALAIGWRVYGEETGQLPGAD